MPNRGKDSTTEVFRALRNRRFHALSRLTLEMRRYLEHLDLLPVDGGRKESLQNQLRAVRRATALYDKLHAELLAFLEQHPDLGMPHGIYRQMSAEAPHSFQRRIA